MVSMTDVRRANDAAGHWWFSRSTMEFFDTRIHTAGSLPDGRYFITSEQPPSGPRMFSVREAVDGGREIDTVGGFCEWRSVEEAQLALRALLDGVDLSDPEQVARVHAAYDERTAAAR